MNVLHLNSGTETGGGMYHILSLLNQLKNWSNVTLGVFTEGELAVRARNMGISVQVFHQRTRLDFSVVKRVSHFIDSHHIDILHTHGPRANFIASLLKKERNYEWFVTVHSNPNHDFLHQGIKGKFFTYLNVRAIKAADHIVAISERFQEDLINQGIDAQKIHVILNGINFDIEPEYMYRREDFGLSSDHFVVLMIARLEPVKSHETAFLAIKELQKHYRNLVLLLAGDGSRRNELENFVRDEGLEENVMFLGQRDDVNELLPLCDITVLTSKSESFPLVLLESARAKKPVITTDVGGVRKLIPNEQYGYIIAVGDYQNLADKIRKMILLKNNGKLEQMGERLYHHARKHFSEKIFGKSVLKIYQTVFEKQKTNSG